MSSPTTTTTCQNCGTEHQGNYCHNCGQRDFDFKTDWRALAKDILNNVFGLEDKHLTGLAHTAFRPWILTMNFLKGKRVSTFPPLRSYLFISLLYFIYISDQVGANFKTGWSQYQDEHMEQSVEITDDHQASNPLTAEDLEKLSQDLNAWMPRVFLVGVVVLALILKLLYIRHDIAYLEHLVFALNLQSFLFLWTLVPAGYGHLVGLAIPQAETPLVYLLSVWAIICPVIMLRRVYEPHWGKAILKSAIAFILYTTFIMASLVVIGVLCAILRFR